jgi:hypothetical protein
MLEVLQFIGAVIGIFTALTVTTPKGLMALRSFARWSLGIDKLEKHVLDKKVHMPTED